VRHVGRLSRILNKEVFPTHAMKPYSEAALILTLGIKWPWLVTRTPRKLYLPEGAPNNCWRRLGGLHIHSGLFFVFENKYLVPAEIRTSDLPPVLSALY
jgi:hypothetical protein